MKKWYLAGGFFYLFFGILFSVSNVFILSLLWTSIISFDWSNPISFKMCKREIKIITLKAHSQLWENFWQMKALALWKMLLISIYKMFKFLLWLFWSYRERSDKKAKVNFKFYDLANWGEGKKNKLSNISRCKGNQTIIFGHLVEFNMKNIFLEKSYTQYVSEISPKPCNLDQQSEFMQFNLIVWPSQ